MSPNLFKKSTEAPEVTKSEERVPLERPEVLSEKETERLKMDVLTGITEKEKLTKSQSVVEPTQPAGAGSAIKSPTLVKIENILETDLEEAYFRMDPDLQRKFKTEGEKTALKIEKLFNKTQVKAKKIFKLILEWLKIIPGVNKFFIQQEAKIKTDKIIKLK